MADPVRALAAYGAPDLFVRGSSLSDPLTPGVVGQTKAEILAHASQALLAQANHTQQSVLAVLKAV